MSTEVARTVRDRPHSPIRQPANYSVNIGAGERLCSTAAGIVLLAVGLFGSRRVRPLALTSGGALFYRGWTGNSFIYRALGIKRTVKHSPAAAVKCRRGVQFSRSITIARSPQEIFDFWRTFERLPARAIVPASVSGREGGAAAAINFPSIQRTAPASCESSAAVVQRNDPKLARRRELFRLVTIDLDPDDRTGRSEK